LVHTGNISYSLGQTLSPEGILGSIKGNSDLGESLGRLEAHLGANEVNLRQTPLRLGAILKMNPETERFTNSGEANQFLTREYHKPFVVPEKL
jgi:hypothetical protein